MRGWGDTPGLDVTNLPQEVIDRFWSHVAIGDCWVWQTRKYQDRPPVRQYVQFQVEGRLVGCHQLAYALTHGVLPAGVILTKTCDTFRCVRHWEAGSAAEAAARIQLAITPVPVADIRAARRQGASLDDLCETYGLGRDQARDIVANRTFNDPDYQPPPNLAQDDHRYNSALTEELRAEIRAEHASGTSINRIRQQLGLPLTTVWEVINGPSAKNRRVQSSQA